ncbi:MAG: hypothetical protein R3A13_01100 [Bdellovibrionota bacterium]
MYNSFVPDTRKEELRERLGNRVSYEKEAQINRDARVVLDTTGGIELFKRFYGEYVYQTTALMSPTVGKRSS